MVEEEVVGEEGGAGDGGLVSPDGESEMSEQGEGKGVTRGGCMSRLLVMLLGG